MRRMIMPLRYVSSLAAPYALTRRHIAGSVAALAGLTAVVMCAACRRLGAPEDLESERVLGRSPVAAYAVSSRIRVAHPGWARDRSSAGCIAPGCLRLAAGTSRSVISWLSRLTKTERLRKSTFTAATGRRAVEHPPQSGFRWRRGFALSVVIVTGHLPAPRRWGARVSRGGLSMTRDASFTKVVRRHAGETGQRYTEALPGETGQRYTEALTDLEGLGARMH